MTPTQALEATDLTTEEKLDVVLESLARIDALLEDFAPVLEMVKAKAEKRLTRGSGFFAPRS